MLRNKFLYAHRPNRVRLCLSNKCSIFQWISHTHNKVCSLRSISKLSQNVTHFLRCITYHHRSYVDEINQLLKQQTKLSPSNQCQKYPFTRRIILFTTSHLIWPVNLWPFSRDLQQKSTPSKYKAGNKNPWLPVDACHGFKLWF